MSKNALTVAEIAQAIDAQVVGDGHAQVSGLGSIGTAEPGQITHLSSPTYRHLLADTKASAVILGAADADDCPVSALVVDNPYLAFAKVSQLFASDPLLPKGIDASATLGQGCEVDADAAIGPNVVIGNNTIVGPGVRVYANTVVGADCVIARDVTLHANVTLYSQVKLGARTEIHSGAVLGAAGFGFAPDAQGRLHEIAQLGGVEVGEDVSIGANSCVDCGAIEDTVIEDGVKIDNHVQIGHNSRIGAHSILCGCVGIAGSSVIGKHCVFAGGSGVGGDKPVTVCDGVTVTACTFLSQSVSQPGTYSGTIVFHEHNKWRRNALRFFALDDLFKRVKRLEKDR